MITVFRVLAVLWLLTILVETPRGIRGWRHEVARRRARHILKPDARPYKVPTSGIYQITGRASDGVTTKKCSAVRVLTEGEPLGPFDWYEQDSGLR